MARQENRRGVPQKLPLPCRGGRSLLIQSPFPHVFGLIFRDRYYRTFTSGPILLDIFHFAFELLASFLRFKKRVIGIKSACPGRVRILPDVQWEDDRFD